MLCGPHLFPLGSWQCDELLAGCVTLGKSPHLGSQGFPHHCHLVMTSPESLQGSFSVAALQECLIFSPSLPT